MFTRLLKAARYLSPQALRSTVVRVDQLVDSTHRLRAQVDELLVRTEQLETAARLDWEMQDELARLDAQLDLPRIETHVSRAVAKAQLDMNPFPHVVVDNWLPSDVYQLMLGALPPAVFFADRDVSRQRMIVPFGKGPIYSRRVWDFVSKHIVGVMLHDALALKFDSLINEFISSACGELEGLNWQMHTSDGRIMLRRPGYVIAPHRDPKWGFVTGLVYLAKPGDNESFGTQLYRVRGDEEAPNDKPYYVDESRCDLVRSVPFKANSMLAFLNSAGAHGASIPADAKPADLERYVYQFRLGPDRKGIQQLLAQMSAERRERWSGGKRRTA